MSDYHVIELLCPVCQEWRDSGTATTAESFSSGDPFITGDGGFVLSCGHTVRANDYKARLGSKAESPKR